MPPYVRPEIAPQEFRDAKGQIIEYGSRWAESPPEDAYSVESNLDRFRPLHDIADALIEHLRETYDVEIDEGIETAADLLRPRRLDIVRSVRVRPMNPRSTSLTFVFDAYPSIVMHAGLLHDFNFPVCGCDACDENWQTWARDLERDVFAIVGGGYREAIEDDAELAVVSSITYPDGSGSGRSRADDYSPERLNVARPILRALPNGWEPWPLRS